MNVLSMHALIGAYQPEGMEWLEELRQVLTKNVRFACDYIHTHFDGVDVSEPQGTYMLFLDCTAWCAAHGMEMDVLLRKGMEVGVIWQDGRPFHGEHSIRMNLALPYTRVQEAFRRLDRYVFNEKR
jgi:cystathionine beta-lyase